MLKIECNTKRAANLLKQIVNQMCKDGFEWYPNVGEMPTLYDIHEAIKILEDQETKTITFIDD